MTDKEIYKELWNGYEQGKQVDDLIAYFKACLRQMHIRGQQSIDCYHLTEKQCFMLMEALNKL